MIIFNRKYETRAISKDGYFIFKQVGKFFKRGIAKFFSAYYID